ncbi:MAG: Hint domain-containing protein [Rhodospirillales bacterium]|nr:Hint domain-containing protein [Rhodospirillales bacterium]
MPDTYSWTGPKFGDWATPGDWTPAGPPNAGDAVIIGADGPRVRDMSIADLAVLLASGGFMSVDAGTIEADVTIRQTEPGHTTLDVPASAWFDGSFGFASGITGGLLDVDVRAGQTLTLGAGATFAASADNAIIFNNGTIANGGTLQASGGLLSMYSGALAGTGLIQVSQGGTFWSNVTIAPTQTLQFTDNAGLVMLTTPAAFTPTFTDVQPGDLLMLGGIVADAGQYDAAAHTLTLTDAGSVVATLSLTASAGVTFGVGVGAWGDTVVTTSAATRVWAGGSGNWYDAANWTSTPTDAAPGYPVAGDAVTVTAGTVAITQADAAAHGWLEAEHITLAGTGGAPVLSLDGVEIGPDTTILTSGDQARGVLDILGQTTLDGLIMATARLGGTTINLVNGATLATSGDGSILSTNEASLRLTGDGLIANDGIVVAEGGVYVGPNVTLGGTATGEIRLQQGGHLTIDGSFASSQYVEFGDNTGRVTLNNLAGFDGWFVNMRQGDRIDITGQTVTSVSYDTGSDVLTLYDGVTQVGSLYVYTDDNETGFHVRADGHGGSLITYTPRVQLLQPSLPVPVVAAPNQTVSLQSVLIQAFGTIPADYQAFGLSALNAQTMSDWVWSYWDPAHGSVTNWTVDGTLIPTLPNDPFLPPDPPAATSSDLAAIALQAGNNIGPDTYLTLTVGGTSTTPTARLTYYLQTIDPGVLSPTAYSGVVDPSDIVASAYRLAAFYPGVPNDNDCAFIGDAVAAAAGATMPYEDLSTDPSANVEGGFWRIVYRGSDQAQPVADWSSIVQAGDVVRMAWSGGGDGQHTTTVLGKNPDGSLEVYDNVGPSIGVHSARYWLDTLPTSITVYRLDPNHQYLINGSSAGERIQGSVYANLIRPGAGADTITAGAAANEIQGTTADLDGDAITDFHAGDSIDVTDLAFDGARIDYHAETGALVMTSGSARVTMALPTALTAQFQLSADAGGTGTLVTLACFAEGTRLRTPAGEAAVEGLRVGDMLCTLESGPRRITWIGHRTLDLRRLPVAQPVRIAPGAFGPGRPARPLLLSPDHAVFADGALIPVQYLVNGDTIRRLARRRVTYWHVELERHDVVLADGLPVESFLDTGQKAAFESDGVLRLHPLPATRDWEADGCAPLVICGPVVERVRARLARSATQRKRA